MSEELRELRCKISVLSACYLEAEARAQDMDKCALVRTILNDWAVVKHHVCMTAQRLLAAEGLAGADEGIQGRQRTVTRGPMLKWDLPA